MKRTRHTPEQIITKLREAEAMLGAGQSVGQVVQHLGVTEQTFNRWRNQCGGMKAPRRTRPAWRAWVCRSRGAVPRAGLATLAPSTPLRSVLGASGDEERVSCHSGWTTKWSPVTTSRRARPRATARDMIPSTSSQLSLRRRDTADVLASRSQSITTRSNSAVKREPGSAQGAAICFTPCSGHSTRGTAADTNVRNWHVSR